MKLGIKFKVILVFLMLLISSVQAENALIPNEENEKIFIREKIKTSAEVLKLYGNQPKRSYVLGANDIISISLFGNPELSIRSVQIQSDGCIDIAGLGNVKLSGLTLEEAREVLNEKYACYVKIPDVSIVLEKSSPFVVYVKGAVKTPGGYEINSVDTERNSFLTAVLVAAGGLSYDADMEHIIISNSREGVEHEINIMELLENDSFINDIHLMSGDSVYVPKLPTPFAISEDKYKKYVNAKFVNKELPVRVFGYVNEPGLIILNTNLSPRINSAIAKAGGYKNIKKMPKKILLSRLGKNGKMVTEEINPLENDRMLMPHDLIYVPK